MAELKIDKKFLLRAPQKLLLGVLLAAMLDSCSISSKIFPGKTTYEAHYRNKARKNKKVFLLGESTHKTPRRNKGAKLNSLYQFNLDEKLDNRNLGFECELKYKKVSLPGPGRSTYKPPNGSVKLNDFTKGLKYRARRNTHKIR